MINLPAQLKKKGYKFCKVRERSKIPYEKEWQNKNNYEHTTTDFQKHLSSNGNYGVIGGYNNLLIIDQDSKEVQEEINQLPETFTVQTGSGGHHYYYLIDDPKSWKITDENKNTLIDFQGTGKQVIGPGSKHPNGHEYKVVVDKPINTIKRSYLLEVFNKYLQVDNYAKKRSHEYGFDRLRDEIKRSYYISDVLSEFGIKAPRGRGNTKCPKHSSKNGKCLSYDDDKGMFYCFHCDWSGDVFTLYQEKNNLGFSEAKKTLAKNLGIGKSIVSSSGENNSLKVQDYINNVNVFYKLNPFFYDKAGLFWVWDAVNTYWNVVDNIDMMNLIDSKLGLDGGTVTTSIKNNYLETLKRFGRSKVPLDAPVTWIQFKNGVYDIDTKEMFEPTPKYFLTNIIPWDVDKGKDCPTIDACLKDWVGEENVPLLKEIIAFCMVPKYFLNRIFCFLGSGRNGKSTFMELIRALIGANNCCSTDLDDLTNNRFEGAKMYKKLVCMMGETNFNTMSKTSKIKKLSGGDLISYEIKNKTPFDGVNYAKLLISTNSLPQTTDKTEGFYRRWILIDFPNKFSEKKDILATIPPEEYSALCGQCIEIAHDLWKNRAFTKEGSLEEREKKYEDYSNPLQKFIKLYFVNNPDGFVFAYEFRELFQGYCKKNGIRTWNNTEIGNWMKAEGYEKKKRTKKADEFWDEDKRYLAYCGLSMKQKMEENNDDPTN